MTRYHYVFDLGNLLFAFDYHRAWAKVAERTSLSAEEFAQRAVIDNKLAAYESGKIATDSFFEWLADHLGFQDGTEALQTIWTGIFDPFHRRLQLLRELARQSPVHVLSNTNDAHITYLETTYPEVFQHFTHRIYSYRVGVLKPRTEIYSALEKASGRPPEELVFFDDRPDNIASARARGWQGHCVRPGDALGAFLPLSS